jgi:hypothetical protein
MTYLGVAHADDSSVLHFPDERAVFSADILQVKRLPGGLAPTVGHGSMHSRLSTLSITSTRSPGTRWPARRRMRCSHCSICRTSRRASPPASRAGRSLAEIQKSLTLDAYKGFERWDTTREAHIAAVYATISGTRPAGPAESR